MLFLKTLSPGAFLRLGLLLVFCAVNASAQKVALVAGGDREAVDIPATEARLREPFGTEIDAAGNLWIIEMVSGNRLLKIDNKGVLAHVAGELKPGASADAGPVAEARFNGPHNLAVLPDGDVLIADTWNHKIRRLSVKSATMSLVPGSDFATGKGTAGGPFCITLDFLGTQLYVADLQRVWAIDLKAGQARVVAGDGKKKAIPADGAPAVEAPLVDPRAVAPDRLGNVYILERNGNALRVVDREGRIRTVVNSSGKPGATGDGGPALEATLNGPKHLCIDLDDSVIIADAENNLIRRYQPRDGKIYRVAGTGKKGSAGVGGDALALELARPHGVMVHPKTGELYITDSYNNRVLKLLRKEP